TIQAGTTPDHVFEGQPTTARQLLYQVVTQKATRTKWKLPPIGEDQDIDQIWDVLMRERHNPSSEYAEIFRVAKIGMCYSCHTAYGEPIVQDGVVGLVEGLAVIQERNKGNKRMGKVRLLDVVKAALEPKLTNQCNNCKQYNKRHKLFSLPEVLVLGFGKEKKSCATGINTESLREGFELMGRRYEPIAYVHATDSQAHWVSEQKF